MAGGVEPWKVAWTYQPGGMIWRVHPAGQGMIVGEERDVAKKIARYFCLDLFTGEVRWDRKSFDEPWWVGIEAVDLDVLYLHGFATPELPAHRGLTAVDLATGGKLWSHSAYTFVGAGERGLVVKPDAYAGEAFLEVDRRTGSVLGMPESLPREPSRDLPDNFLLPIPLQQAEDDDERLMREVRRFLRGRDIAGEPERVHLCGTVVFNYHERVPRPSAAGNGVKNRLAVIELASGAVVYEDTLDAVRSAIVPDAFFIAANMLFYVRERTQLTAVRPFPATSPEILQGKRP